MGSGRTVTADAGVTPEAAGRALAFRQILDAVEPMALEARGAVKAAEGHDSLAFAEAKAKALEGSVAKLRGALRDAGLFV